jgi:hypothetical protein
MQLSFTEGKRKKRWGCAIGGGNRKGLAPVVVFGVWRGTCVIEWLRKSSDLALLRDKEV